RRTTYESIAGPLARPIARRPPAASWTCTVACVPTTLTWTLSITTRGPYRLPGGGRGRSSFGGGAASGSVAASARWPAPPGRGAVASAVAVSDGLSGGEPRSLAPEPAGAVASCGARRAGGT